MIIPPGYGSAAFVFTGGVGTSPFVTTIGVDLSDAGGDYVAAAETCFWAYSGSLIYSTTNAITLDHVLLTVGVDGGGVGSVKSTHAPRQGERTGEYQPMSTAAIARKTTNFLGRRGQGRMFLPGVVKDEQVNISGIIDSNTVADLQTRADDFLELLDGGRPQLPNCPAVLFHSAGGPAVPSPIMALTVTPKIGLLRRRIR